MPNKETPIYTIKEAAKRLRIHPRTAQRLLKSGKLGGFRIGIDWRTTEADIEAFIEASRPNTPAPGKGTAKTAKKKGGSKAKRGRR